MYSDGNHLSWGKSSDNDLLRCSGEAPIEMQEASVLTQH